MSEKEKSFMDRVKEIDQKEREALENAEREAIQREEANRKSYGKQLNDERVQLMKLKAGLITEKDSTIKKEVVAEKDYSFKERFENFIYHYKGILIVAILVGAFLGYMTYDSVTTVKPDITVMVMTGGYEVESRVSRIERYFERYCKDYNGDGEISVDVYYIQAEYDDTDAYSMQTYQVSQSKLIGEFRSESVIMVVTTEELCRELDIADGVILTNMAEKYPDDVNAGFLGYSLSDNSIGSEIGYPELSTTSILAMRNVRTETGFNAETMTENYRRAEEVFENIRNNNVINDIAVIPN